MDEKEKAPLQNPTEKFHHDRFPMQKQDPPGIQAKMNPVPDCGERSYVGHGLLKGRKALITGGDSGIGRAAAIAYAREGARVAINYLDVEQEDADSLKELLAGEGIDFVQVPGDLRDEQECARIIKEAHEKLGGMDILVLNAAVQVARMDIAEITAEQLHKTFEVNVYSLVYLCRAAVPLLPEGSSVIVTGSAEYYTPNKMLLDYAASKFAAVGFSIGLSKQLIDKGIRVNVICPGPVWTPLEVSGGNPDEWIPKHGLDTPLKRPGQPVELSGLYVFLASDQASYVTGEVYGVTGGLSGK